MAPILAASLLRRRRFAALPCAAMTLLLVLQTDLAFSALGGASRHRQSTADAALQPTSRRDVLAAVLPLLGVGGLGAAPQSASAQVGEGDLPQGAKQEDRIRKGLEAWKKLPAKISDAVAAEAAAKEGDNATAATAAAAKEWENAVGFLRRLYGLNDDMTYLSRGFKPAEKKEKAETLINKFKKQVKLTDKPVKAKDYEKFLTFHTEITGYIEEFNSLLLDAEEDLSSAEATDVS
ncbi:unnamed protein product [Polarella glacialis]|uniref:Uncharacterized protein n=1 Tax=Polarella glacialis TaxID=89957 RepID=A0A813F4Q6_POLGL|nr:unnamed protein product [Polarella glacialis]CAE8609387.1 unnamed protein product [Polarella glacialis]|mmetsp:Transcript_8678/g.13787  ORF Transcript_8678/g.13787 Transcript_8678/m.13787 type:complete len:235 (-) Transcript_8678:27-731(-)